MILGYSLIVLATGFVIAALGSFASLSLGQRIRAGSQARSMPWLIGGSIGVGSGLWAQHFLHLLACKLPVPASYGLPELVISYTVAVLTSAVAVRAVIPERDNPVSLLPAAILIGSGIAAMRFVMLSAMRVEPPVSYDLLIASASTVLGILASWGSLAAVYRVSAASGVDVTQRKAIAAVTMACSITFIDDLGLRSARFAQGALSTGEGALHPSLWLDGTVATICFLIIVFMLLAVMLDRRQQNALESSNRRMLAVTNELEQRVAERTQSLVHQEALLRGILASALDCIITTDVNGVVTEFNAAAEATFGYRRDQAVGRSVVDLIVPEHRREIVQRIIADRVTTRPFLAMGERRETEMRREDGSIFPAEFSVSRIQLGSDLFFNMFLRDITSRRAADAALTAAKEAAEAASDAKTTFLATMSHEIRTPMNALLGLLELLSFSRLDDDQRESVRLMRQSSKSLLRLIDDILDFSKIEAGKLEVGSEPTPVRDVVTDVCATFSAMAREKGIKLECRMSDALPHLVMTDPLRLRQILSNLVSNAIKFTRRGEVTVWAAPAPTNGASSTVEFEVTDSGIGMSEEVLSRCGEPFEQADAGMARRYGGSGLGLAICRRLCGLMNGTIDISSKIDVGTRILVRLPLEPVVDPVMQFRPDVTQGLVLSMPSNPPTIEQAAASRRLILVVDDHPTNRSLLVQQLEWLGYACEACEDGRSALRKFRERLAANTPYAMTITDCQMPEMDGYDLAREIRKIETGTSHKTVLIAFTANTMRSVSDVCHSAGFNDLLIKPTNLATLKVKLDRWLPLPQGHALLPGTDVVLHPQIGLLEDPELQDEFRQAHEEDLAMLREGNTNSDAILVARAAHRIKGAARMIGSKSLDDAATALLRVARGEDWRLVRELTAALNRATINLYEEFDGNPRRIRKAS